MRTIPASTTRDQLNSSCIVTALNTSTHIFVHVDGVRLPLKSPYIGPSRRQNAVPKYSLWTLPADKTQCQSVASNLPLRNGDSRISPFHLLSLIILAESIYYKSCPWRLLVWPELQHHRSRQNYRICETAVETER